MNFYSFLNVLANIGDENIMSKSNIALKLCWY